MRESFGIFSSLQYVNSLNGLGTKFSFLGNVSSYRSKQIRPQMVVLFVSLLLL